MRTALFTALAFISLAAPAWADTGALLPGARSAGSRAIASPVLSKLVSTRLLFVGAGASMVGVTGSVRTTIPSLSSALKCPGPSHCYVEAEVEMQVAGTGGAMGFDLLVDGAGVDSLIGANYALGPATAEMTARRFVVRVPPGSHSFAVAVYGTEDFSFGRHSVAYRVFKQ